jgi:hypothetical protein
MSFINASFRRKNLILRTSFVRSNPPKHAEALGERWKDFLDAGQAGAGSRNQRAAQGGFRQAMNAIFRAAWLSASVFPSLSMVCNTGEARFQVTAFYGSPILTKAISGVYRLEGDE